MQIFLLVGFLLVPAASGLVIPNHNPEACGRTATYKTFLIADANGKPAFSTHLSPWAVQIRIQNEKGNFAVSCGGTLISEKHVITAAHCFRKEFANEEKRYCKDNQRLTDAEILAKTQVTVGAQCAYMTEKYGCKHQPQLGKTMKIKRFAIGDFFINNCEKGHDIVIMELDGTMEGLQGANYVCLPFGGPEMPSGVNVTSFGWGSDPSSGFDKTIRPMVQVVELAQDTIENCKENWEDGIPFDSFCTVEETNKNVCTGDSGGGVTYPSASSSSRQVLVGVVSFGSDCAALLQGTEPKSQINTDIRMHEKFILDFMKN